jgi:hypothetical protein
VVLNYDQKLTNFRNRQGRMVRHATPTRIIYSDLRIINENRKRFQRANIVPPGEGGLIQLKGERKATAC